MLLLEREMRESTGTKGHRTEEQPDDKVHFHPISGKYSLELFE